MPHDFWTGAPVLITGASSGIGAACARLAAGKGAKVGLIARRGDLLQQLCAEIRSGGGLADCAVADVCDESSLRSAMDRLQADLGPCRIMIASAGIYRLTNGRKYNADRASAVFNVNLLGAVHAVGAVLPGMCARNDGRIAVISSLAAKLPLPGSAAYSGSKAGLDRYLDCLRVDLRKKNVKITTISPGFVDTQMLTDEERKTLKNMMSAEAAAERVLRAIERGQAEHAFPTWTWLEAWFVGRLPGPVRRWICGKLPAMEET